MNARAPKEQVPRTLSGNENRSGEATLESVLTARTHGASRVHVVKLSGPMTEGESDRPKGPASPARAGH